MITVYVHAEYAQINVQNIDWHHTNEKGVKCLAVGVLATNSTSSTA